MKNREFRIPRSNDIDLVFDGVLLVDLSSHVEGQSRWTETRIYRTTTGKWVTEVVGKTLVPGEVDRYAVAVHKQPEKVRIGLMRRMDGERYLTDMGRKALTMAAEVDPELRPGLIERI